MREEAEEKYPEADSEEGEAGPERPQQSGEGEAQHEGEQEPAGDPDLDELRDELAERYPEAEQA